MGCAKLAETHGRQIKNVTVLPHPVVLARILVGDCRSILPTIESNSVNCCVTSPPYFGLRNYDHPDQIGIEATPAAYVTQIVSVLREVRRVLHEDGTVWLNLGDSYGRGKQLLGIPWRVAFALQDDGWVLRSEIIWAKSAHKPERVRDRPTTAHERLFLLAKSPSYYYNYDAVAVASSAATRPQRRRAEELATAAGLTADHLAAIRSGGITDAGKSKETQSGTGRNTESVVKLASEAKAALGGYYREFLIADSVNLRSVWNVPATRYPGIHTAVFPPGLIEPCIKAGCPEGGIVLDPFAGSGTTGIVAAQINRSSILIEINPTYGAAALKRIAGASLTKLELGAAAGASHD